MKKFICLLFSLVVLSQFTQAQIATVSDEITLRNEDAFEVVGKVENHFFVVKKKAEGASIFCFDSYMKLNWENDVVCEKKNFKVLGTIARPDYFGIIIQYKMEGNHIVAFQKLDENGAIIDQTIVKNFGKRSFSPRPISIRSTNQKKFVIFFDKEDRLMEAVSFDTEKMEVLWDETIKTQLSLRNELYQLIVSNEGSFYTIFYKDYSRSQREKNKFTIYKLDAAGNTIDIIPLESNFLFDVYFDFDNLNNQLVGAGLYDTRKPFRASGYFFLKVPDNNPSNKSITFEPFPEKIMTTIRGKESDEKDSFIHAYVNNLVLKSDGGVVMIVERFKKINHAYTGSSSPRNGIEDKISTLQAEYHYSDIVVVNLTPEGKSDWNDVLYKRQFSRDDGGRFSSFMIMKNPKKVRFIYNDEIKYNNKLSEYSLSRTGENKRSALLDTDGYNINLMMKEGIQTAKNEIIVPSVRKRDLKLVRIKFGE